ncbi:MAG: phage tail sheath family protein [bacterium]|nr:phage tail sheath family protein [bacterium]
MNYTVPGVFIEPEPQRVESIKISKRCLTGFIGVSERGPIHQGIKITSFKQYQRIFGGFTDYSYLAHSIFGFFNTGGKECIVVRTAHMDENDEKNSASKSWITAKDIDDVPFFEIQTLSEGTWGNNIEVKLWHVNTDAGLVENSDAENRTWVEVESPDDYSENDVICIRGLYEKEYRTVAKIENNRIHFNAPLLEEINFDEEDIFCENVRFNLLLINGNYVEQYFYLTANENDDKYFIDEVNAKSKMVEVREMQKGMLPGEIYFENLRNGRNGILSLTPGDFIGYYKGLDNNKGIGLFEAFPEISLIAAPDVVLFEELVHQDKTQGHKDMITVQKAMVDQCERLDTRFAILDLPDIKDIIKLMDYTGKFDTRHAAVYYPKLQIVNPEDMRALSTVIIPPSGHIAGVYAECDEKDGIFRAPANKYLTGAVGLTAQINDDEYEIIYPRGINILRSVPGRGIKVWGARTLSSDTEWKYINVRRTFSVIKRAIKNGTGWAVFEPNDKSLRKRIVRHVSAFLLDLWREGYMAGVVPEDGYFIRCDDELNPVENIDAGIITVEIGIAIAKPAEYLVMSIKSDSGKSMVSLGD